MAVALNKITKAVDGYYRSRPAGLSGNDSEVP
jgi:hypothetical protein